MANPSESDHALIANLLKPIPHPNADLFSHKHTLFPQEPVGAPQVTGRPIAERQRARRHVHKVHPR